jgi:hypothetical protein
MKPARILRSATHGFILEPRLQSASFGGQARRLMAEICQLMPVINPAEAISTARMIIAVDPF